MPTAYISAAREAKARAAGFAYALGWFGVEVPCRWWETIPPTDVGVPHEEAVRIAEHELHAIQAAGVVVLLTPHDGLGCQREAGIAIGLGVRLVVLGSEGRTLFDALATRLVETEEEALAAVLELLAVDVAVERAIDRSLAVVGHEETREGTHG